MEKSPLARTSLYGRNEVQIVQAIGKIHAIAKIPMKAEMKRSLTFCLFLYFVAAF
jgi:hypothetical protein